ncbi:unnamed protein product [Xylocopa violacea]|uniref:Odorant receptor n=1 Tax=Xylocopa violacea TaxID=135666 RepID=A0ABP1NH69_XYLVO
MNKLQRNRDQHFDIFDIPYYNKLKKYLQFLGQDPHQRKAIRNIIVTVLVISTTSIFIPTSFEFYVSICNKDMGAAIECMPHLTASAISTVKILNVYFYRENFKQLFDFVTEEWKRLTLNNGIHVLEEITVQGSKFAQLYRYTILTFTAFFLLVPLIFPILDIVLPLNETRPRQQIMKVNYLVFNGDDYFCYVYLHLAWGAVIVVVSVVAVDSLYILTIHHNSGLFAVCGYQVQKVAGSEKSFTNEAIMESYMHEQFKNCVITHDRALQFYHVLNESLRISYLLQVGFIMIGISAIAVQMTVSLDTPEEALRAALFLIAKQFHLFMISLPGQILLDHCSNLSNNIYGSTWYRMPVKIQKMLHTMQMKTQKLCTLTAGGLYTMNMENFGTTFKTCMSYFTMLTSLKE